MYKKSLILFAAALLTFNLSQAQTSQGTRYLGLNLGFSSWQTSSPYAPGTPQTPDVTKSSGFNVGPTYSRFFWNNTDIGARLSYSSSTSSESNPFYNDLHSSSNAIFASVYARRYFLIDEKIGFRAGPYVSFLRMQTNNTYTADDIQHTTTRETDAGLNMDLVFYPVKRLGFAATIADMHFAHSTTNQSAMDSSNNGFVFNTVTSGLSLSAFYIF